MTEFAGGENCGLTAGLSVPLLVAPEEASSSGVWGIRHLLTCRRQLASSTRISSQVTVFDALLEPHCAPTVTDLAAVVSQVTVRLAATVGIGLTVTAVREVPSSSV